MGQKRSNQSKLGPVEVTKLDELKKFFTFCKNQFQTLSNRQLHQCFSQGFVYLNGIAVQGENQESIRLSCGDVVEISSEYLEVTKVAKIDNFKLNIIYEDGELAVIYKNAGVSAAPNETLDLAIKSKILSSESCQLLYRLEKNLNGLCIIAKSINSLEKLREKLCTQQILLSYHCLVCGLVGDSGNTVRLPVDDNDCPQLQIYIQSVHRCRSTGYISNITVTPLFSMERIISEIQSFSSTMTNNPTRPNPLIHYPSTVLKNLKRALFKIGHPIVGDNDMVKRSKGLYATLSKIEVFNNKDTRRCDAYNATSNDIFETENLQNMLTRLIAFTSCSGLELQATVRTYNTNADVANILGTKDVFDNDAEILSTHPTIVRTDNTVDMKNLVLSIEVPVLSKFSKLLEKEDALWSLAASKENTLLMSSGIHPSTDTMPTVGGIEQEDSKITSMDLTCGNNCDSKDANNVNVVQVVVFILPFNLIFENC